MKICLIGVFPEYPTEIKGGVANVIFYLARSLKSQGHRVQIISTGPEDKKAIGWEEFEVYIVKAPLHMPRILTNATIVRQKIHAIIRKIKPDICHFHGSAAYALNYRGPFVFTFHGIPELDVLFTSGSSGQIRSLLIGKVEKYCRQRVDNFIIINNYLKDVLGNQISGSQWLIENPVDSSFFDVSPSLGKTITYAGMISRRKNVFGLLRAWKRVHRDFPEAILNIAGPVREKQYLVRCQTYIADNKLQNAVSFLGSLNTAQLQTILARSSGLVLASYQETAPLVIAEAMAAGLPVVASDIGGVPYMVKEGVTGYLVAPDDHNLMAERLLSLLENESKARSMGLNAREEASARFHVETITDKTLKVYDEILTNWTG